MLKTALQPKWIATLVLALVLSGVFVFLSQWQFARSQNTEQKPEPTTENVTGLTGFFEPGMPMHQDQADQMVTFTGHFVADKQVLVQNRLYGEDNGYWVVAPFVVDGAPTVEGVAGGTPVIPVARGWIENPAAEPAAPTGQARITGRLIPTEAPKVDFPVEGQVSSLSAAELTNRWQVPTYSGFVTAEKVVIDGRAVGADRPGATMRPLNVEAQPQGQRINWLNVFYGVEWVVFAGFSVFLWWRLVSDDYRRSLEDEEDLEEWGDWDGWDDDGGPGDGRGGPDDGSGGPDGGRAGPDDGSGGPGGHDEVPHAPRRARTDNIVESSEVTP